MADHSRYFHVSTCTERDRKENKERNYVPALSSGAVDTIQSAWRVEGLATMAQSRLLCKRSKSGLARGL